MMSQAFCALQCANSGSFSTTCLTSARPVAIFLQHSNMQAKSISHALLVWGLLAMHLHGRCSGDVFTACTLGMKSTVLAESRLGPVVLSAPPWEQEADTLCYSLPKHDIGAPRASHNFTQKDTPLKKSPKTQHPHPTLVGLHTLPRLSSHNASHIR